MKLLLISVKFQTSRGGIATWTERSLNNCQSHNVWCEVVNTELVGKRKTQMTARRGLLDELVRTRRIFKDLKKSSKKSDYDAVHLNTSCGTFGLFRDYFLAKRIEIYERFAKKQLKKGRECEDISFSHNLSPQ